MPLMASQSIQRRIDLLLDEANKAVAESNWAVVLNCAEHVLRMNTENEPARAFMAVAERELGLFTYHPEDESP